MSDALVWVDWVLLAVLVVSVVVGLLRGFTFELMSLAGWVVAYFAAQWALPYVAPQIPVGTSGSALNLGASFAICFFVVLIVWSLLTKLLSLIVRATPLTVPDRVLGAAFGLLRGSVLLLAAATLVTLTPVAQSASWQASIGARWLGDTMQVIKPLLPPIVAQWLPA